MEQWRPAVGFEGLYSVSDRGRIRRDKATRMNPVGSIVRTPVDQRGYPMCSIRGHTGKFTTKRVHVMVLEAFAGPRPEGYISRHLDGNPSNNNVSNLRWGTYRENSADTKRHGRATTGENHPFCRLTEAKVRMIRVLWEARVFPRCEIAEVFGISDAHVSGICNGTFWKEVEGVGECVR